MIPDRLASPAPAAEDLGRNRDRLGGTALWRHLVPLLVAGAVVLPVLAVTLGRDAYLAGIAIETLFWVSAASGWNILGGYSGMISLGHALFIGVSGYAVTFAVLHGWSWWFATPLTVVAVTVIGTALLYPGFRLRGPFFTLATFALPLIATTLAIFAVSITGGPQGETWPINPSTHDFVFASRVPYLLIIGVIALITLVVSVTIDRLAIGRSMRAAADDDIAAESSGVPTTYVRLFATATSIALSSLAGCFYVTYIAFIDPSSAFALDMSLKVVLLAILGGLGRPYGPLIGAVILIPADSWLAGSFPGGLHVLLYGVLLIVLVLFLPQGVIGGARQAVNAVRTRRGTP
jgi:ABC-type branched-subunit amino acid transport system permease subunit